MRYCDGGIVDGHGGPCPGARRTADRSRRSVSTSSVATQLAARLVADAGVGRDDRVVDLGAGTGVLTAALAARAAVGARGRDRSGARGRPGRGGSRTTRERHGAAAPTSATSPLPLNPYRVVANPPFGRTAAILHRLLDDPAGGLVRADLVVQWQVARHRARVQRRRARRSARCDLGALVAVRPGPPAPRRPASAPGPSVDAAVLRDHARDPPAAPGRRVRALRDLRARRVEAGPALRSGRADWVERFRARR